MEKDKIIKIDKKEFIDLSRMFFILLIIALSFFVFYKIEQDYLGLISVISLSIINYFLSKKYKFLYILPRLYLSLFVPILMIYFKII